MANPPGLLRNKLNMMSLKIITHPNPLLRQKASKVETPFSKELLKLAEQMIKTMRNNQGIGLAAPQVGVSRRLIVIAFQKEPLTLFNPEISKKSFKKEAAEEGCLSLPGVFGLVKRHHKISVAALDKFGKKINFAAEGMLARVIQHEVDHLNGILFIDKIKKYPKSNPKDEEL